MDNNLLQKGQQIIDSCETQDHFNTSLKWIELVGRIDVHVAIFLLKSTRQRIRALRREDFSRSEYMLTISLMIEIQFLIDSLKNRQSVDLNGAKLCHYTID
jgi:hypothetical protein